MGGYQGLINKLDGFIRKYYKNQMLKGALYSLGLIVLVLLVVLLLEAIGQFSSIVRTALFYTFILSSLLVLSRWVFLPMSKLFRLGKVISYDQASLIVGEHFPAVKDKLLNTLQLKRMVENAAGDSLLEASIDQKTKELSPVPFASAIDLKDNTKYLKYALPPLVIFALLFFFSPSTVKDSTDRLIRHSEEIVPVAPYAIQIQNEALEVAEKEDFILDLTLSGEGIPNKLFVEINGTRFPLEAHSKTKFQYTFRNVQRNQNFRIYGNGFYSEPHELRTLPKPLLLNFVAALDYPSYVQIDDEQIRNSGDLTVPEGTEILWDFETINTDEVSMRLGNEMIALEARGSNHFIQKFKALKNTNYTLRTQNAFMKSKDSISYRISVIPDLNPSINVNEEKDSLSMRDLFFTGEIKDDYGFKRLQFKYTLVASENDEASIGKTKTISLKTPSANTSQFFYHWQLAELNIQPGDEFTYFFEVWDNDAVNGSKSARTVTRSYAAPSIEELEEKQEEKNEEIKDKLQKTLDDAKKLQDDLDKLREEMLNKKELGWQEKKKLEEILKQQQELQKQVQDLQKQNQQKDKQESEFNQQSEEIQEKQQQLQELFDELMSDEMKEMYKEMEKLMEEMNKEDLQEQIEEMTNEDLEKELDRALEQFKQLEFEMKMEDTIDKLKELADKQKELAEESKKEDANSEELKEEQEKLNEEFEKLQEDLEELDKMNEELEEPNEMPDTSSEEKEIKEEMNESSEKLGKKKASKASENQDNASDKMEEMAENMEESMQQQEQESEEEDMEALRALLENIITLSFDEELLMADIQAIDKNDPKYVEYGQQQRKLKDDAKMVEDSLFALSKRVVQIQGLVNREIGLVNDHMGQALDEIAERRTPQVVTHQQYVMTSFNNLALLLDEALQQMQQQMSCKKPGKGNCEKPGGNGAPKPSAGDIKKMQKGLSKQLQEMKEKLGEKGNKGENKGGQKGMSKQLAKQAAKQGAIRQMMEKLGQQLNEDGSGNGNEIKQIAKEMEQIEEDIVNKRITQETIQRQQDIMVRLLKAENAERTRGEDEKRKSEQGDQNIQSTPLSYTEYQLRKQKEIEMLKTVPPSLKPYYRDKVNEYFNNLER